MSQKKLLEIVKKWKINPKPQYRDFRCADCQKYIHKAWHHYLDDGGFKCSVHFCRGCEVKFKKGGNNEKSVYQAFTCDNCGRNMFKAFHIWEKKGNILGETHYCKKC